MRYRPPPSWRDRHVFAVLGLRAPIAQHTSAEGKLLQQYSRDARHIVELGVAKGGSALECRQVMAADGTITLVDPYPPGQLRTSLALRVARRTVSNSQRGRAEWMQITSDEAARTRAGPIDFLFIDADHSYQRAAADWAAWSPWVVPDGVIALHDSRVFTGGWTDPSTGPVRPVDEILSSGQWHRLDGVDSRR